MEQNKTNSIYQGSVSEYYESSLFVMHQCCPGREHRMPMAHFHDGYELYLALSDDVIYLVDDKEYRLQRGGMMMVNNNEVHRTIPNPDILFDRYIVGFLPEYVEEYNEKEEINLFLPFTDHSAGRSGYVQLTEEQIAEILEHFNRLQHYIENEVFGREMLKKIELTQILLLCQGYWSKNTQSVSEINMVAERLRPIMQYIRTHPAADLRLDQLSEHFFVSKSHLIRMFHAAVGMTPNEYIIMIRIMYSRQYLMEGMPIMKVCELVGYADESHFIRTFKKIFGMTPKKYVQMRKKNQNDSGS